MRYSIRHKTPIDALRSRIKNMRNVAEVQPILLMMLDLYEDQSNSITVPGAPPEWTETSTTEEPMSFKEAFPPVLETKVEQPPETKKRKRKSK